MSFFNVGKNYNKLFTLNYNIDISLWISKIYLIKLLKNFVNKNVETLTIEQREYTL